MNKIRKLIQYIKFMFLTKKLRFKRRPYQLNQELASHIAPLGDLGEYSWVLRSSSVVLGKGCDRKLIVMLVVSALRIDPRVEREARALAAGGYQIVVICPDISHPRLREFPLDWGDNIKFDILDWDVANYITVFPGLQSKAMLKAALVYKPLAYHCHDLNTALIGLTAARTVGAKYVCDFHEWYSENVCWNNEIKQWIAHPTHQRLCYQAAEALVMSQADELITVCDSIADELNAYYPEAKRTIHVIRNIPSMTISDTHYPSLRTELNINQDKLILLWQGGTGPTRLLEPVIESLAYATEVALVIRGPSLDLFGEGYLETARQAGVSDRLYLLSPVKSANVVAAANGADVGIWTLPNLSKNFYYALPNKIFEYLAAGLPIICANFPEARVLVERYKVGGLFDPYDPRSIADALKKFSDHAFRITCTQNIAAALRDLKANQEWDKLVCVYNSLLKTG